MLQFQHPVHHTGHHMVTVYASSARLTKLQAKNRLAHSSGHSSLASSQFWTQQSG